MWIFPGLNQIVKIKASAQTVDLISFFVNHVEVVAGGIGVVKIKCVGLVTATEGRVIKLIPRVLSDSLRIRVVSLLVVAHVIDVVVRIGCVVLIPLAGVFELVDLKGLLDENILYIIW